MSEPNDPEPGDSQASALSEAISLALVVLAIQGYAELGNWIYELIWA